MSELITLPTDPNPAIDVLLSCVLCDGTQPCCGETLHAAVHLAGYVVGKLHVCPAPVAGAGDCHDLKSCLESLKGDGYKALNIPWKVLLKMLLEFVDQIVDGLDG